MPRFERGNPGRRKGTQNKLTTAFKDGLLHAYHELGGAEGLAQWARQHPGDFYRIMARLIPQEIVADVSASTPPILVIDELRDPERIAAARSDVN